jgi:uncharacterized repeat protein (TIGR01451 family)
MRMSVGVSGHPNRGRWASRAALVIGLVGLMAGPVAPIVGAAGNLTVTTPYPAIVVEPGSTANFELAVEAPAGTTVSLAADGAPSGWTTRFLGSGTTVDSVYIGSGKAPGLTFAVEVPAEATSGSHTITVNTSGGGQSDSLQLTVKVEAAAGGDVTLKTDFPELKGTSASPFSFSVTLKNGTTSQATYSFNATGPDGWTVSAKPTSSQQATSIVVDAGGSTTLSLSATPPSDVKAGTYPVNLSVSGGGKTASVDVAVTITGSYTLSVSTPDSVLSTTANAGTEKTFTISVTNGGTAPVTAITPTAAAPTGWKVTFEPATIDSLDSGKTQAVVAKIVPSADAITGDYNVTMTATGAEASGNTVIRVRVETPGFWMLIGAGLIVLVLAGLYWVFRTYGRR